MNDLSKTKNYNKNKGLLVTQTMLITLSLSGVYLVDVPVDAARGSVGELCGKPPLGNSSTGVHRSPLWTNRPASAKRAESLAK